MQSSASPAWGGGPLPCRALLALFFGALFALLLCRPSHAADAAATLEAESMNEASTGIAPVSDAGAVPSIGNNVLKWTTTGDRADRAATLSAAATRVEVRARGVAASNTYPSIRVYVDGTRFSDAILTQHLNSSSYQTYTASVNLSAGSHTVYVTCMDAAKTSEPNDGDCTSGRNAMVDSIAFAFSDTTAPDTTIDSGPSGATNDDTPTFTFSGTDNVGITGFECRFDSNSYQACTSPHTPASALSAGSHTIYVRAKDAANNVDGTPASRSITVDSNLFNVKNFGATTNDATNDTAAFERAMAEAAKANGVAYVPAPGTYRLAAANVPSDTTLKVAATATLKKYGTASGPLFKVQGPTDTTFAKNVHIVGDGGRFTMDLSDAGQDTPAIQFQNVDGFSLEHATCVQNNDNQTQGAPSSRKPCLSFTSSNTSKRADGTYNDPRNGLISDAHAIHSPYGWGLVQMSAGHAIDFENVSGEGGVPLRLENYQNYTPMSAITANGVTGKNCHTPVMFNPHGGTHLGNIHVKGVTASSCESAVSLTGDGTYGPNVSVEGITVNLGNTAQLNDPNGGTQYPGAWLTGPSKYCILDRTTSYEVALSVSDCGGLPSVRK